MQAEGTLYEVLGVAPEATLEEIKKAHRKAMRVYHPDVYSGSRADAEEIASRINKAYAALSDPQEREKYDALLRGEAPEPEGEPFEGSDQPYEDDWGAEAEWEEVVDEEVVEDEPAPSPQPPPAPESASQEPAPDATWRGGASSVTADQVRFLTPLSGLRVPLAVALGGALVGVTTSLIASNVSNTPNDSIASSPGLGTIAVLVGITLGIALAVMSKKKGGDPTTISKPLVVVILALAASAIIGAVVIGGVAATSALVAGVAGAVGAHILTRALMVRSMLEKVVKADSLRKNNTFGGLSGGVGPDLLNRSLSAFYDVPSVRMMRNPDNDGLFSHAVLNGHKVAFVKAITGTSGLYRWSGPSLLRDRSEAVGTGIPEEVLRATYREFSMAVRAALPQGVEVDSWLFVYTQDGDRIIHVGRDPEGNPQVTAPDVGVEQVGRFLMEGETEDPSVDQETFIKTFSALLG